MQGQRVLFVLQATRQVVMHTAHVSTYMRKRLHYDRPTCLATKSLKKAKQQLVLALCLLRGVCYGREFGVTPSVGGGLSQIQGRLSNNLMEWLTSS